MADKFDNENDDDLGRVSSEFLVFNPNAPNSTGWVPPEYSGGGSSGGGSWHPPEIVTLDDPPFGPAQPADNAPAPAPSAPPVRTLPPSAQDEAAANSNTVLIGIGVIALAVFLLKK